MTRPPFPTAVDNSMRVCFRRCPTKFYWEYIRNLTRKAESVHLRAGKAYAQGLEAYRKAYYVEGLSPEESLAKGASATLRSYGDFDPGDSPKTAWNMVGALEFYSRTWMPGTDFLRPCYIGDDHAIEYSFQQPLSDCIHPETGEPILYCGRLDMLAERGQALYVVDDKTTHSLGPTYPSKWKLNSQPTGYVWSARQDGHNVVGAIIRAVAIKKGGYDAVEVPLFRKGWEIQRWREQVTRDIHDMIACWQRGAWDYDLSDGCTAYGGCEFMDLCGSPEPERWIGNYVERTWNPITGD